MQDPKGFSIYVGCALTFASKEFKASIADFKECLRRRFGVNVLEFLGEGAGNAEDVYETDIVKGVGKSDLMVAVADKASTGLGIEFGAQIWLYRGPVLVLASHDAIVTRLVPGVAGRFPHQMRLARYKDLLTDGADLVWQEGELLRRIRQGPTGILEFTREKIWQAPLPKPRIFNFKV